jgi:hypothetical protein
MVTSTTSNRVNVNQVNAALLRLKYRFTEWRPDAESRNASKRCCQGDVCATQKPGKVN